MAEATVLAAFTASSMIFCLSILSVVSSQQLTQGSSYPLPSEVAPGAEARGAAAGAGAAAAGAGAVVVDGPAAFSSSILVAASAMLKEGVRNERETEQQRGSARA